MSAARYRKLLTNLPSMAAIVNSFQAPEVQLAVYRTLMDALEDSGGLGPEVKPVKRSSTILSTTEVEHDLVEGDSIHSLGGEE